MQASTLQRELQQSKPFASPQVEAALNLARTHGLLSRRMDKFMRDNGLTATLYNVLRIVRGAGEKGIPCLAIGPRMLARVPDVTRLVDRLVKQGLVERVRIEEDRRVVLIRLTNKGLTLMAKLEEPLLEIHNTQLGHMTPEELETLSRLLVKARHNLRG